MIHLLRQLPRDWRNRLPIIGDTVSRRLPNCLSSCEFSNGRGALSHLLARLRLGGRDSVLVPAYVAEGVMRPLLHRGVRVLRYRLTAELQPDENDIDRLLRTDASIRMLVIVHPLGWEARADNVRQLAMSRGCHVLDDCAHGLLTDSTEAAALGSRGDFALFSLNKFLPVPDGAFLLSNRDDVDLSRATLSIPQTEAAAIEAYLAHLEANAELLNSTSVKESETLLARSSMAYDEYYHRINSTVLPATASSVSHEIRVRWDARLAGAMRRRNAERLYDAFPEGPLRLLARELPDGVTPFAVAAVCPAGRRDAVVAMGARDGVLFSTLVARWDFIETGDEERFTIERSYLDTHILISVSEFLDDGAIDQVADVLVKVQQELKRS